MDFQVLYDCVAKLDSEVAQITESDLPDNEQWFKLVELFDGYRPDNQFILDIYVRYLNGIADLEKSIRDKDYQQSLATEKEIRYHTAKIKAILEVKV